MRHGRALTAESPVSDHLTSWFFHRNHTQHIVFGKNVKPVSQPHWRDKGGNGVYGCVGSPADDGSQFKLWYICIPGLPEHQKNRSQGTGSGIKSVYILKYD